MGDKTDGQPAKSTEEIMQSVVKLFVQKTTPDYSVPWQMKKQRSTSGSGFVISNRRLLTNAHVVSDQKSILVRKHGDPKKYVAHILHVGHECDVALVGVSDDSFWEGLPPLEFADIPVLEDVVVVVGYPTGGDNICVTSGVVSRVDIKSYTQSGVWLLAIQIDAAINSGNSGGPALREGKVVGIAFQSTTNRENMGYIIPIPVINHFLEDIERNGKFSGICDLGIYWQLMESEHIKKYFKLENKETGVLISKTAKTASSYGNLQYGDVLMSIDDVDIADNGTVPFRAKERITWSYIIDSKFPGDIVKIKIKREGKIMHIDVKLHTYTPLVPHQMFDKRPSYVIYCGVVFTALSRPYLHDVYGKDWSQKATVRFCNLTFNEHQEHENQEVVILGQVLASELTMGYEGYTNTQLYSVNGVPILNLKHLCHLLDKFTTPHTSGKDENADSIAETKQNSESLNKNVDEVPDSIGIPSLPLCNHGQLSEPNCASSGKDSSICIQRDNEDSHESFANGFDHLYTRNADPPLLFDTDNFIYFELDKQKVVVLDIAISFTQSAEILKNHAITSPRSEDLPPQPY